MWRRGGDTEAVMTVGLCGGGGGLGLRRVAVGEAEAIVGKDVKERVKKSFVCFSNSENVLGELDI